AVRMFSSMASRAPRVLPPPSFMREKLANTTRPTSMTMTESAIAAMMKPASDSLESPSDERPRAGLRATSSSGTEP
ncbi:hypothetical protein Dimus_037180, partial [Dionaea muscipula]